jgi:ribose transport system ATP-binding protein
MMTFLRIKARSPEQIAGTLSGGNQQKVIFGKMLLTEARVLLLYDPTRGVDVGTKGEIFVLMRDLAAKGYAILFYSSDLPELVHVVSASRDAERRIAAVSLARHFQEGIRRSRHVRGGRIDGPIRWRWARLNDDRRVGKAKRAHAAPSAQPGTA